jgi:hypothetical protein
MKYIFIHQSGKNGFLAYGSEHNLKTVSLLKNGA